MLRAASLLLIVGPASAAPQLRQQTQFLQQPAQFEAGTDAAGMPREALTREDLLESGSGLVAQTVAVPTAPPALESATAIGQVPLGWSVAASTAAVADPSAPTQMSPEEAQRMQEQIQQMQAEQTKSLQALQGMQTPVAQMLAQAPPQPQAVQPAATQMIAPPVASPQALVSEEQQVQQLQQQLQRLQQQVQQQQGQVQQQGQQRQKALVAVGSGMSSGQRQPVAAIAPVMPIAAPVMPAAPVMAAAPVTAAAPLVAVPTADGGNKPKGWDQCLSFARFVRSKQVTGLELVHTWKATCDPAVRSGRASERYRLMCNSLGGAVQPFSEQVDYSVEALCDSVLAVFHDLTAQSVP